MTTILPDSINTIEEAQKFLTELYNNKESYHPEDDAHDCFKPEQATKQECDQLNKLMEDVYKLTGDLVDGEYKDFDPCGFLLHLDPDYVRNFEND